MSHPKVRHGPPRQKIRQIERITEQFGKLMSGKVKRMIDEGFLDLDAQPTVENLLSLRKRLVEAVKKGMLERQDQEEKIGMLAAMIWWCRLEEQRRFEIEQSDLRG